MLACGCSARHPHIPLPSGTLPFGNPCFGCALGSQQELPSHCTACGCSQDPMGDHALSCAATRLYARHNYIRDTLASILCNLGFPCRTEVCLPGTDIVPADIFIPSIAEGSPTAVDVSVVHPLQPSHHATATVTAGTSAEARAASKVAFYSDKCSTRCWAFSAFVAGTTGAWSHVAQRLVRKVSRAHSLRSGEDRAETMSSIWCALSRALAQSVGKQLVTARLHQDLNEATPSGVAPTPC